jgi:hypothetical protein
VSEFLLNLARRSVGLGPVIEARRDAVDLLPRVSDVAPAAVEIPRADMPPPHESAREANAPPATGPMSVAPSRAPLVSLMTAAPMAVIQRQPSAAVTTTESPARAPAASPPPPPNAGTLPLPTRTIEYHVESTIERQIAAVPAPVDVVPRAVEPSIRQEGIRPVAAPAKTPRFNEYLVAPRPAALTAFAVEPRLAIRAPTAEAGVAPGPPERTIHVRIGAIEIHGNDAPPVTAAPPAAPPSSAPASPGFDEFVRLRSYAPWAR